MKGVRRLSITQKDLKKSKDLVEKLLKVQGQKYNDWLHQQHQTFIEDNQDLILEALSAFTGPEEKETPKEDAPSDVSSHENPVVHN
ncbi:hypothetical protein CKF96_03620 (plasmid) [Priestia filamentosa]|nr:hypothetical protein CKF96_03620 [Priestia filamentosa]MBG9812452.1 hypothetical protein [Priestia endophytica]